MHVYYKFIIMLHRAYVMHSAISWFQWFIMLTSCFIMLHHAYVMLTSCIRLNHVYLFYCNLSSKIGHDHVHTMFFRLRPIFHHAYAMHSAISWFHVLEFLNDIQIAER
jgi:hypothetical protein